MNNDMRPQELREQLCQAEQEIAELQKRTREAEIRHKELWEQYIYSTRGIRVGSIIEVPGQGRGRVAHLDRWSMESLVIRYNPPNKNGEWSSRQRNLYPLDEYTVVTP